MNRPVRITVYVVAALLAALFGVLFAQRMERPPELRALVLEAPRQLPDFALLDHRKEMFGPARLQGKWTLLFFGFTNCPDVCPTTLDTLARAVTLLQDLPAAEQPVVTMVSVDPMRDTPEQLAAYVPFFDPGFVGVTGPMDQIMALTRGLGVAFAYTPAADGDSGSYTVEHTASIFLIDPAGRLAAVFSTPHRADELSAEYRWILGQQG